MCLAGLGDLRNAAKQKSAADTLKLNNNVGFANAVTQNRQPVYIALCLIAFSTLSLCFEQGAHAKLLFITMQLVCGTPYRL